MAADFVGAVPGRRRKSARERRNQALRSEARRLRHAQVMGAAMAHRGDVFHRKFGARAQQFAPVVPQAGLVSRGSVVDDGVPSLLLPCVHGTVPEHDPGLVRFLLTRTLLDRELEETNTEKEKGDVHVLAVPSSPVVGSGSSSLRLFPFLDGYSCRPPELSHYGFPVMSWVDLDQLRFQVFYSERAKLFLLRDGSWVKQEWGNAQLLLHDVSGKMCFFMRADVSQRALCSSLVVPDTCLVYKGERSVHWELHDHSTGSLRSLRVALLFQDELRRSQFVNAFYEAAGINEY